MNTLEATRKWMRDTCPLIDKHNMFNASFLGAQPTEYSLAKSGESHRQDVCGFDHAAISLSFFARMPLSANDVSINITAADFFDGLNAWIMEQDRAHSYPTVDGYQVTKVSSANAGIAILKDESTAQYQLQIQLALEEV